MVLEGKDGKMSRLAEAEMVDGKYNKGLLKVDRD